MDEYSDGSIAFIYDCAASSELVDHFAMPVEFQNKALGTIRRPYVHFIFVNNF